MIKEYFEGNLGYHLLTQNMIYQIALSMRSWVRNYKEFGHKGLSVKTNLFCSIQIECITFYISFLLLHHYQSLSCIFYIKNFFLKVKRFNVKLNLLYFVFGA